LTWINRVGAMNDAPAKPCAATRMLWRGSDIAAAVVTAAVTAKKAGEAPAFLLRSVFA
jgi:hypothetical protein